jgi:hypothetical protein
MTDTKPLNRTWAKVEIFLGLGAAGVGLFLGHWALFRPLVEPAWDLVATGLALFVLGGYLTLAGHRSHLYQSLNEQTALLIGKLDGAPHEPARTNQVIAEASVQAALHQSPKEPTS